MKIIVGLGNYGKEFEMTRHNVAWIYLNHLEEKYNFQINKKMCDSLVGNININGNKVIFAKPLTYMNLSGNAVQKLKKWHKVENNDFLIVYDDIDIPLGEVRYRESGSAGTHNGMKNIVQLLNTSDIPRLRIGIGGVKHPNQDLADFVLQKFTNKELLEFDNIFDIADKKLLDFIDK